MRKKRPFEIIRGMAERHRRGEVGNRKHSPEKIREFKRRIAAGEVMAHVARDLGIASASASEIKKGHIYADIFLLALLMLVLMGSKGCPVGGNDYEVNCQGMNYPLCRDVPYDYPCLCLDSPDGVSRARAQDMRSLNDR